MLIRYILLIILITISTALVAQGKLCIAKYHVSSEDGIGANHAGPKEPLPGIFDVQIDNLKKIRVSQKVSVCLDNLSVKKKHLIKIYRNDILKESFWFTFDKKSYKKCLRQNGLYLTWMLSDGACR